MIQSGQEVEVLKTGDEWTYVRLPDGKEGWIISHLLTSKIPNCLMLEQVKKKREALMIQSASLLENNAKLKAENKAARSELAQKETMLIQLGQSYETLKTESADFLKLKSKYDQALSQRTEQKKKTEELEKKLTSFEKHRAVMWFLAGAGVLLVGFLIGFSIKQRQRLFLR
jgi:SH3 domain protein